MSSSNKTISIIDQNTMINGELLSNSTIDILGSVTGLIISDKIITKQGSNINGKIYILNDMICEGGTIIGDIFALNLKLFKNAVIKGNIFYNKIVIEHGAVIDGICKQIDQKEIENRIKESKAGSNKTNAIHGNIKHEKENTKEVPKEASDNEKHSKK